MARPPTESTGPHPTVSPGAVGRAILALLPVVLSAAVYRPLLDVYFNADDFLNLFYIVNKPPAEYLLRPHGGHLLLTRNALFYLFFQVFGPQPQPYFWAVWLTHLLNVALLFQLIRRLSGSVHAASFAAVVWGVCPVHTGTLGWYSVYGQVLVATILLVILNRAAGIATGTRTLTRATMVTWPLLLFLASTCFGVGIGITVVAPLAVFLLLPRSPLRTKTCLGLCAMAIAMPIVYRATLWLFDWAFGPSGEGLAAAVMLQNARVSWNQLMMTGFLFSYGLTSLLLGFFLQVGKFPVTAAWIATAMFTAAVTITFVRTSASARRQLLALTLLALSCYAIIALGRSPFFQAANLTTAAAQPRYHYVAPLILAVMLGMVVADWCRWLRLRSTARSGLLLIWIALAAASFRQARPFIDPFLRARNETSIVLSTVRSQVAAAPPGADVYIPNRPFRSIGPMVVLNQVGFPGWAAVYTIFFPTNVVDGRHIYFVVEDSTVVGVARKGRRTADLIVLAGEASGPQ